MITQSINLNLIPGAVPPRIKVSQYDFGSRTLQFTLFNGTSPFTTASLTARIQGTKPDNKGFSYDATYNAGVVTADVTRQMTACAGAVICELVIVDGSNNELGTGNFILDVEAAALSEDTDISETEIPAIIDAAEANAERAEAAAELAEAASAHAPYIGDNEHWYVWDSDDEQYVDSGVDAKGDDGATIVSVEKTSTSGYIDTYTITMSDGTTSTFTVTNGTSTLPGGGTKGQVLTKKSGTTGDADWSSDLEEGMESLIDSTVGWTGKNLLENNATTTTTNGITFTVNSDGSVTVSTGAGGATADTFLTMHLISTGTTLVDGTLDGKNVVLSGCPSGGSTSTYWLQFYNYGGVNTARDFGEGSGAFTVDLDPVPNNSNIAIIIKSGQILTTPITFYPMIRLATVTDSTYEPYHKSVEECLEEKIGWGDVSGDVQKNMLPFRMTDKEDSGITFRQMSDGTVKVWGTATANTGCVICQFYDWNNKKLIDDPAVGKSVVLSGAPANASASTFYLNYYHYNGTNNISDYGNGTIPFTPSDNIASGPKHVQISVINGANLGTEQNPTIFKPMIRLASVEDPTYAPYVPSNSELYNKRIKTGTVTGTTGAGAGALRLGNLDDSSTIILEAHTKSLKNSNPLMCVPYTNEYGHWYVKVCTNDFSAALSTDVTVIYSYIEK